MRYLLICVLLAGCTPHPFEPRIDGLEAHLRACGVTVEEAKTNHYYLAHASNGVSYLLDVDDRLCLTVLEFDTGITSGREAYERILRDGVNGQRYIANGNLVARVEPELPNWPEVERAFLSY